MLLWANHRYVGSIGSSHKESTSPMPIDHPKRKKKIGSRRRVITGAVAAVPFCSAVDDDDDDDSVMDANWWHKCRL